MAARSLIRLAGLDLAAEKPDHHGRAAGQADDIDEIIRMAEAGIKPPKKGEAPPVSQAVAATPIPALEVAEAAEPTEKTETTEETPEEPQAEATEPEAEAPAAEPAAEATLAEEEAPAEEAP